MARDLQASIDICFGTDNSYVAHTATAMASILQNANRSDRYHLYVIAVDLASKNKRLLKKLSKIRRCQIDCVDIDAAELAPFGATNTLAHLNLSAYNRLMIPKLFPHLDRMIYIDSDTIAVSDIGDLISVKMGDDDYFAAINDPFADRNAELIGYKCAPYINTGVMIFNNKALRENNYFGQILSVMDLIKDKARCADQDFINYCFHDHMVLLPQKWNVFMPYNFKRYGVAEPTDEDYLESKYHPKIIHFVGPVKPWSEGCQHPLAAKYWEYRELTPWGNERKKFFGQKIESAKKLKVFGANLLSKIERTCQKVFKLFRSNPRSE